jgi:hypothetical protein
MTQPEICASLFIQAIFYVTSILILLLSVFNANYFLPAMVPMRVAQFTHQV